MLFLKVESVTRNKYSPFDYMTIIYGPLQVDEFSVVVVWDYNSAHKFCVSHAYMHIVNLAYKLSMPEKQKPDFTRSSSDRLLFGSVKSKL